MHAVVIGAGFGGISAAAHLARAGHTVTVLEATDQPGGRARVLKKDGFTFDLGPSWYLMPDVFEEWFAAFGHKPQDFYELRPLTPSYQVFTGTKMITIPQAPAVFDVFERIEPGSGARLRSLFALAEQEYRIMRGSLLSPHTTRMPLGALRSLRVELARSYHNRIAQYVRDPDLQHILEFMTVFLGGSPHTIPAFYALLAYVDMGLGAWYPMGGFGVVAHAMASVARGAGATFRYNTPATRIETHQHQAQAVWSGDERIACDAVVANADYHFVETALLAPKDRSYSERYWQRRQPSPSGVLAVIGVQRRIPNLVHHNLFFDADWDAHFAEVFTKKVWSRHPLFYLSAPTRTDTSIAPKGHESLFFFAPMAAGVQPTLADTNNTINTMIARVEHVTNTSFTKNIVTKNIFGPDYFASTFNAYKGNAFGLSHTFRQTAGLRPKLQSKRVKNVFYTGQYTTPGTGVPLAILSGTHAAQRVLESMQ